MSKADRKLRRHLARNQQQATGAKKKMSGSQVATKPFSKAETKHLMSLAATANAAIQAHSEFVQFLSDQHEAPAGEGWTLGATGFVRQVEPVASGSQGIVEAPPEIAPE